MLASKIDFVGQLPPHALGLVLPARLKHRLSRPLHVGLHVLVELLLVLANVAQVRLPGQPLFELAVRWVAF